MMGERENPGEVGAGGNQRNGGESQGGGGGAGGGGAGGGAPGSGHQEMLIDYADEMEEDEDHDSVSAISEQEYEQLDAQLDDLNVVLDVMEQKNDRIRAEFLELLQSSKEIREEIKRNAESSQRTEESNSSDRRMDQ